MAHGKIVEKLPPWALGVIGVSITIATAWVGFKIYKKLNKSGTEKSNINLSRSINTEILKFQRAQKASYNSSQYSQFANTIYDGMKQCVGDDYGTVEKTLKKMNNDLDVALLIKEFGARQAYCFAVPVGDPKDLFTFVNSELGSEWGGLTSYRITSINNDWNKKGITYKL